MEFFSDNIFLILIMPVWVCFIIASGIFLKLNISYKVTLMLTLLSSFTGLIFSGMLLKQNSLHTEVIESIFPWLSGENLNIFLGSYIDLTSCVFLSILMLISFIVQLYSYGYMKDNKDFNKYFIYLNFFNFAMTGLILSPNLIQMYIFWELVGAASYILVGFFHNDKETSKAAKRVFIINRIGDCAFLAGIIIFAYFSITYIKQPPDTFLAFNSIEDFRFHLLALTSDGFYNLILLLFIIAAFVKSAQFPFNVWLVDAMKAPTPVSALIHSATMVCMGVFLIIRIFPLLNNTLLYIILFAGLTTAVLCAFIACSRKNIKKMLAYSTSSQLGLIFTALGLGAIPAAIIYLVIHSFTKALLFLCSGVISKTFKTLDMDEMHSLRKSDFYLAVFWIIAALSLSGLFFGGFTSKEILIKTSSANIYVLILIFITSFMTAFYSFKSYFKIFEGEKNDILPVKEKTMLTALTVLSVFVIIPGLMFKASDFDKYCIIAVITGIAALFAAYSVYKNKKQMQGFLYNLSFNELYLPFVYKKIGCIFERVYAISDFTDKYIIDGFVYLIVRINTSFSKIISRLQNGNIQTYIVYSIFTAGVIISIVTLVYHAAAYAKGVSG